MLKRLELDETSHHRLAAHCQEQGIHFLSTPFDLESLDFLVGELDMGVIKLPSGAVTHAPLLLAAAATGKKVILSTGMSTLGEVEQALVLLAFGLIHSQLAQSVLQGAITEPFSSASPERLQQALQAAYQSVEGQYALDRRVILLHCTSAYPTPFAQVNLRAMDTLRAAFGLPVGLSDHTQGITAAIAAVAREAVVVEKHFTLDRSLPGPDHKASLEPGELGAMVQAIRDVASALGDGRKGPQAAEQSTRTAARHSLVALRDVVAGTRFSLENLGVKRPGTGISPMAYWAWLGKRAGRDFRKDETIG